MFLLSFFRVIKFAFQDFLRNIWLSLVTISTMILTFISIAMVIVLSIITQRAVSDIEKKVDVSVFFRPEVEEYQLADIQKSIHNILEVDNVSYKSRQNVLDEFKEKHKDDEKVLEALNEVDANPFGAVMVVNAKDVADYPAILEKLNDPRIVPKNTIQDKSFDDHRLVIEKISNISDRTKEVGVMVSFIFGLIALLIVFNTIRISIYTHKREISIMKLVGASNWFIRTPFLLEGFLFGLLACAGSILIIYPILHVIQPYLGTFFQNDFNIITYFNDHFIQIFGLEFLAIIVLNGLTSAVAMRKYLKI